MYFGNYGTGNIPRILASKTTTWTSQGSNIWKSDITFTDPDDLAVYSRTSTSEHSTSGGGSTDYQGSEIYFELINGTKQWGHYRSSAGLLTGEYQWAWVLSSGVDGYMYIYCASPNNPNSIYTAVEIPQRQHIVDLAYKNYIQINGLALLYSGMDCISYSSTNGSFGTSNTNLIVEYCEIAYVSTKGSGYGYGIEAPYSNSIFRHNEFHDCGRRAISFHLAHTNGTFLTNILIEDNNFHDGWHTTGPDFNVGTQGGSSTSSLNGVIIRRNLFYDDPNYVVQSAYGWDWSEHMFFQNYNTIGNTQLQNFYIYSNVFVSPKANSLNIEAGVNINVIHNTFYNHNTQGTARAHLWVDYMATSIIARNNIYYSNVTDDDGGNEMFLNASRPKTVINSNYNLFWRTSATGRIIEKEGTPYNRTQIASVRSAQGWEIYSPIPANPNFVNPSINDFNVMVGSAAIGAGTPITVNTNFDGLDYEGNSYLNPPTIGAFQY
jgi:hypothetical protein